MANMKRKNRNKKFLISFVALFVLLFGVGYAYLNQRVDIIGKTGIAEYCRIFFENMVIDDIKTTADEEEPAAIVTEPSNVPSLVTPSVLNTSHVPV